MSAVAFLGTSDFAAAVLRRLADSPHRPRLVVSPPDRRRGRGRRTAPPPVAELARELGLTLHQTAAVSEPDSVAALSDAGIEVGCVCAFGQLIREPLLSTVEMLNIHPSLLPRWRGAAPIERAILARDSETGVCVMRLDEGLDTGPVALCERTPIGPSETTGELSVRLAVLGGELLVRALDLRERGELELREQAASGVTYAEKIEASERRLELRAPAVELAARVRALTPHIGAWLELAGGQRLGVRAARAAPGSLPVGRAEAREDALAVGCGEGVLLVERLQPAGGREMAAGDYLRGHPLPEPAGAESA